MVADAGVPSRLARTHNRRVTRLVVLSVCVSWGVVAVGCASTSPPTSSSVAKAQLPLHEAFIASLTRGDRDAVLALSTDDLRRSLEPSRFDELSDTFALLGAPNAIYEKSKTPIEGGERRHYVLDFDVGLVDLELSVRDEHILGFRFAGGGFEKALNQAHAHSYGEFRVYDFDYVSPAKLEQDDAAVLGTPRVEWSMVVGGLEQMGGRYDVTVEQMCFADGKAIFREPISFDLRFAHEGGATGTIGGHVEVPGPGTYDLDIVVRDNIAVTTLHHQVKFKVTASR